LDPDVPGPFAEAPAPRSRREHPLFHLLLLALTFLTATLVGGVYTERGGFLGQGGFFDGLPFSVPLLTILGVHELGHYLMCRRYGIAATLPYFLPSPLLVGASFFLFGAGPILWTISQTTLRQTVTPGALLGRVSALVMTATAGVRPVGAAIGAAVGIAYGPEA